MASWRISHLNAVFTGRTCWLYRSQDISGFHLGAHVPTNLIIKLSTNGYLLTMGSGDCHLRVNWLFPPGCWRTRLPSGFGLCYDMPFIVNFITIDIFDISNHWKFKFIFTQRSYESISWLSMSKLTDIRYIQHVCSFPFFKESALFACVV